ncbi:hypothetical protein Scep_006992 [Stephania cephalantha]|uniref:Uncharacterized protein n=1 Tax=Stephania cephalantha TaxID=152367 RepID=A0AAP0KA81_9MAGN
MKSVHVLKTIEWNSQLLLMMGTLEKIFLNEREASLKGKICSDKKGGVTNPSPSLIQTNFLNQLIRPRILGQNIHLLIPNFAELSSVICL